jgi:outer membrane biosynthesis protein TonB
MIDNLKKGDTVLTYAGVIGKIVGIEDKQGYKTVTLETGNEKHKGYMCIDVASIYSNLSNPVVQEPVKEEPAVEEDKPIEAPEHLEEQPKEETTSEEPAKEEVVEEQVKPEKKSKSKKSKK